ncbi:hypothetical protein AG1IA_06118 [Rhizoctonia solani AG-1 IA]|uniref:Uncharacterized protein n=1 Tax=Thanatephorus cucumeris (strain AG1-IA) TaxID=983506 RepID=L8WSS2_THACA|nr:hypothetical protein AG1IA_06118 [Rhizoctonia solani AG-1 IA]
MRVNRLRLWKHLLPRKVCEAFHEFLLRRLIHELGAVKSIKIIIACPFCESYATGNGAGCVTTGRVRIGAPRRGGVRKI